MLYEVITDTQALALLVKSSARPGRFGYAWMLESKLIWDRLMRAGPGDKFAVVITSYSIHYTKLYDSPTRGIVTMSMPSWHS